MASKRLLPWALCLMLAGAPFATVQAQNGPTQSGTSSTAGPSQSNGLNQPNGPQPGVNPPPAPNKSTQGQGSPRSSLSPNAMTPNANPNGQGLPEVMGQYTNSVRNGQAPANSGPLNPNNPK